MDLADYSFLEKLINLEILIISTHAKTVDFDLLRNLPKLKILDITNVALNKNELDFQNNNEIEFINLSNVRGKKKTGFYELSLKNVPKSLKCIDMSMSAFVIINKKLLESLKNVPVIVLYKDS
jgi:hypothetical protein